MIKCLPMTFYALKGLLKIFSTNFNHIALVHAEEKENMGKANWLGYS